MPQCLAVRETAARAIVYLVAGDLSAATARTLGVQLDRLADEYAGLTIRLDLDRVEYLSGAVLGKIVAFDRRVAASGGEVILVNVNAFPLEQLQLTHLDQVLHIRAKEPLSLAC